jgi:hypothetical protein
MRSEEIYSMNVFLTLRTLRLCDEISSGPIAIYKPVDAADRFD